MSANIQLGKILHDEESNICRYNCITDDDHEEKLENARVVILGQAVSVAKTVLGISGVISF